MASNTARATVLAAAARTANDPLVDAFIQHQVRIQGLSEAEVRKFAPFLKRMDKAIRRKLSGDALTSFSRARLTRMLVSLDEVLGSVFSDYDTLLMQDLREFAAHEATFSTAVLQDHIEGVSFTTPSANIIRAAMKTRPLSVRGPDGGKLLQAFIADWSEKEREAVTGAIRRGVVEGQTNEEMVRVIRGTRASRYTDGILSLISRHARAVTHTAVQHVSSVARQEVFEANSNVVKGAEWNATLDSHTCAQCRSLDGVVFRLNKGPRPPIHVNDRCTMVPKLAKRFEIFDEGATRPAVMDGEVQHVPVSVDYYHWLKKQPDSFIREVLGPKRAKLFTEGGLSVRRFQDLQLDRNWQPLTLAEMRDLEPVAFHRAGL